MLMNCLLFYVISAVFQPHNGGVKVVCNATLLYVCMFLLGPDFPGQLSLPMTWHITKTPLHWILFNIFGYLSVDISEDYHMVFFSSDLMDTRKHRNEVKRFALSFKVTYRVMECAIIWQTEERFAHLMYDY